MLVAPATDIELLVCPLTADQENQITFDTLAAQKAYFDGIPSAKIADATYQRKDQFIRWPASAESVQLYNYVRYKNPEFLGKWFYAFIERVEYVNPECCHIYIKTDVYQTWMFDFEIEPSFVEREHVSNDGIGLHTMPENLEIGEYRVKEFIPVELPGIDQSLICIQVSDFPSSANVDAAPLTMYNGMPCGCYYLVFQQSALSEIRKWINAYVKDTKADAILSIFPIPSTLAQPAGGESQVGKLQNSLSSETYIFLRSTDPIEMTSINIPYPNGDAFGSYTPRNNKLYTYPYCYFYFNNFTGSTVEYHYEDFYGPLQFTLYGAITAGGEFKMLPTTILGAAGDGSYGYGMSLSSMPQGSWNNDTYLNWKALNTDAIAIEATRDALATGLGAGNDLWNLNFLGAAEQGINYGARVAQRMNQQKLASKMPSQSRGDTATQSLNWSMGHAAGGFYRMCIREEYAKVVDDYFTAFGYRVNEFKTPNIKSRQYWNYIKTVGVNLVGTVPQDDLIELKHIFDNGITFWHDPTKMFQYSLNNPIVV